MKHLILFLALLSTGFAQKVIDFHELPKTDTRLPVPDGYANMHWENLYYVTNQLVWSQSNFIFPNLLLNTPVQVISAADPNGSFNLESIAVTGDPGTELTVQAFNGQKYVGFVSLYLDNQNAPWLLPRWGWVTTLVLNARKGNNLAVYTISNIVLRGQR